ncbi:hypothetical protein BUALT_Bualt18G0103300 [Buddleja alternifolia]|uniref:BHLH domain-containing protein n=1 Tax=Buddleja alternifolia TaxID=168488 RepID=A0AAV6WAD8_9LAMI|nr:hypothetical protein BUALT_Bualt18G0103300 [Buddleja alternifolia]
MAEEFQGEVCGGNWSRSNLFRSSTFNDNGSYRWPNHDLIMPAKSCDDSASSENWSQDFLHDNGRSEDNYSHILQEDSVLNPSMNYQLQSITSSNEFASFPLNSASYSYNSSSLQSLFHTEYQSEESILDNNLAINYQSLWNVEAGDHIRASFVPSTRSQFLPISLNNVENHSEEGQELASVAKKFSNEPVCKRLRIETPSPLPTFKTDTASVLHEAIEYIKFLHDQVSVLSSPYLKNESRALQFQQNGDKIKDEEDLKSRGLCLVTISSTFPVASEITNDFWTPTFGGSFR